MTDQPMATVDREGDTYVVRFERHLAHPREKVWRAITESEHLVQWLPCDMIGERRAGGTIQLPFRRDLVEKHGIDTPTLAGRIDVWDPPAVFEWWWSTDRLRWELDEADGGTSLRFTTWLGADSPNPSDTAAGYHVCLANLGSLLDSGSAPPLVDADTTGLETEYGKVVARA